MHEDEASVSYEPKLYKSYIYDHYIKLLRDKYPQVDVQRILETAGMKIEEVLEAGRWFTQSQADRFHAELDKHFRDQKSRKISIAREGGRYFSEIQSRRAYYLLFLSLMNPSSLFDLFGRLARYWSRAIEYESNRLSSCSHMITIRFKKDVKPQRFQCDSTIGYHESAIKLFTGRFPEVSHPECYFEGAPHCRYIFSWEKPYSRKLRSTRAIVLWATALSALVLSFAIPWHTILIGLWIPLLIAIMLSVASEKQAAQEMRQTFSGYSDDIDEVIESYEKYNNYAALIGDIGRALSKHTSLDEILENLIHYLYELGYKRGTIYLIDHTSNQPFLNSIHCYQEHNLGQAIDITNLQFDLSLLPIKYHQPQVVIDLNELREIFPNLLLSYRNGKEGVLPIYLPIIFDRKVLGFFLLETQHGHQMTSTELHLLEVIAIQTALAITNLAAFESVVKSEKLKSEFAAFTAHELRTPIQIVMMALDELKHEQANGLDSTENVKNIESGILRLKKIVSSVLDYTRLEELIRIETADIAVDELLENVRPGVSPHLERRHHTLTIKKKGLPTIRCEPDLMSQVLINLIVNSAKYTPDGGQVLVAFTSTQTEYMIEVVDNGIGIPTWAHEKVFTKFFQVKNEQQTLEKDGCGLGLTFCNEVVRKHGGFISLISPVKRVDYPQLKFDERRPGTRITIHLPLG